MTTTLRTEKIINWGIIGPGNIAEKFATGLKVVDNARCYAVASRNRERAEGFAERHGAEKIYASYQELCLDPDVDIVYVATPHTTHEDSTRMALAAGKAVLCEKPLTPTKERSEALLDYAKEQGVLLMEGMWTSFMPYMQAIREHLKLGHIGTPQMVHASLGFRGSDDPNSRLLNPQLAGGSLLDVGVYPLAVAYWIFGCMPDKIEACAHIGSTGVDEQVAVICQFPGGGLAVLDAAVRTQTAMNCRISGSHGSITVPETFWRGQSLIVESANGVSHEDHSFEATGFEYEARAMGEAWRKNLLECPGFTHQDSRNLACIVQTIRDKIQLIYPFETPDRHGHK